MSRCYTCDAEVFCKADEEELDADGTPHRCKPLSVVRGFECDQCGGDGPCVLVGEPLTWETATAQICAGCLAKAADALRQAAGAEGAA